MSEIGTLAQDAIEAIQAEVDREIVAAWRAGYQYLHRYEPVGVFDPTDFTVQGPKLLPSHSNDPATIPQTAGDWRYAGTYDLSELTREQARKVTTDE